MAGMNTNTNTNLYLSRRPMVLGLAKVLFLTFGSLPFVQGAPFHPSNLLWAEKEKHKAAADPSLWLYLSVAAALVLLGGAFAGLTIALMGQDEIYLQVIRDSGEGKEKIHAGKVLRLLHKGKHWVLVTLLLSNVITNETLPIVLDRSLGGGWPAVLGSTVLIVIFGEIVPQSICVRYGLPIGAWMSPFVLFLMYAMAPIAWPTAKLLDYLLGEDHGTVYKKAGLKTLVSLHRNLGEAGQRLHADEVTIISAVLDLKEKMLGSIMTPMDDVFTLSLDEVLDEETMDDILKQGYSRIPVHHPDNDEDFVGMLLVKMLITYDPEDAKPVRDFALATLPETKPSTSCLDIMNFFQEGKSHMVLISDHPGKDTGALGVVTLEDVIEELIGEEIIDESDVFVDVHKAIRRMAPISRTRFPKTSEKAAIATKVGDGVVVTGTSGDLIDINEGQPLGSKDLLRTKTADNPPREPMLPHRRSSAHSASGERTKLTKQITNIDEVREHLKHLGPSNLASRPKTTRYSSVKIKPGAEVSSRAEQPTRISHPPRRISEGPSEYSGGIGEGVLPSGGRPASDGVQALAVGYGTMSTSPNDRRPSSASKAMQARSTSFKGSESVTTNKDENESRPPALTFDSSEDAVGDLPSQPLPRSPYFQSRGPARSGSITENIIDTNGIRKIVLETTSSSESNGDEESSGQNTTQSNISKKPSKDSEMSATNMGNGDSKANEGEASSKKKKKKHKKKNKKGQGENEPLLHD